MNNDIKAVAQLRRPIFTEMAFVKKVIDAVGMIAIVMRIIKMEILVVVCQRLYLAENCVRGIL